jgi:hypothetical protein
LVDLTYKNRLVISAQDSYTQAKHLPYPVDNRSITYRESVVTAIYEAVDLARAAGFPRPTLFGASIGSLPLLEFIACEESLPAVFMNPVYSSRIESLSAWREFLGYDFDLTQFDSLCSRIESPVLVVHGYHDTVAPYPFTTRFAATCKEQVRVHTEWQEGHIFSERDSWRNAFGAIDHFLSVPSSSNYSV